MMKTIITLTVTAVLFAITANVAEAAKINPSPMSKPSTGGTVFEKKNCLYEREVCRTGNYTESDYEGCRARRAGRTCRQTNQKARCDIAHKKCKKTEKKKTLPSDTGTIMKTVPMKLYKMTPTK
jgi:hypothetical protein